MALDHTAFEHLKPTSEQLEKMASVRRAFAAFVATIDPWLPEGPDKTFIMRQLRDCAMWANVSITRHPDGGPRGMPPRAA